MKLYKVLESKLAYAAVCVIFALGILMSVVAGGSMPGFGAGLLPEQTLEPVAQSPLPPPGMDDPWLQLAQSPLPPPGMDDPWLQIAQSPLPPPGMDDPWLQLAQSPLPPPGMDDPWLCVA